MGAGSYTAYFVDANGCSSSTVDASLSDPGAPAKPVISAGGPASFCIGGSVTLTSSTNTGLTWSTGETTQSITVTTAGNYFVTSSVGGCSSISEVMEITVISLPSVSAGTYSDVCDNVSPINLNAGSPSGGVYSGTGISGNTFDPSVGTQTLTYTYTDGNGCSNTGTTTFTVLSSPTIGGVSDVEVCDGESATLTATGGDTYAWDNGVSNGVSFVPTATGTYTVTATGANSCVSTMGSIVTVNTLPVAGAGADQTICEGTSTVLNGTGGTSYTWNNGVTDGISFTPTVTTTYVVTATDLNNCSATDQVTVTLIPMPTITGTASNPTTCSGTDGTIVVSGTGTGDVTWTGTATGSATAVSLPHTITGLASGSYDVLFTDGTGCASNLLAESLSDPGAPTTPVITADGPTTICEGDSVVSITVKATGAYSVTVSAGSCSTTSIIVNVTVNASPTVTAGTDMTICEGDSVTLTGTSTDAISWDNGVIDGVKFAPTATTTYTVTATNSESCTAKDEVEVVVNSLPVITIDPVSIVCVSDAPITLSASPAGGTFSGTGVSGSEFDPAGLDTGSYVVTYDVTENGCSASLTETVVVDSCLTGGVSEMSQLQIAIYPNPSTGVIRVKSEHLTKFDFITVRDQIGRMVVDEVEINGLEHELNLNTLSSGTYFITVHGDRKSQTYKVELLK